MNAAAALIIRVRSGLARTNDVVWVEPRGKGRIEIAFVLIESFLVDGHALHNLLLFEWLNEETILIGSFVL